MDSKIDSNYEQFFDDFKKFWDKAQELKNLGFNDYNPLLAVRSYSDEAKLHSRIIHSLLDPNGSHYKDDLFLELFLEQCGLDSWFDINGAFVYREYNFIDIFISNGAQHIIIENKIGAPPQHRQIERYIKAVRDKDSSADYENIAVIYLSPQSKQGRLGEYSLGEWKINGGCLESVKGKIHFRFISYDEHILKWIEKCQEKVGNITDLNAALNFYKDAVKIIMGKKENPMSIVNFLESKNTAEYYKITFDITRQEKDIKHSFFCFIYEKHLKKYNWKWIQDKAEFTGDNRWRHELVICHDDFMEQTFRYFPNRENGATYGIRLFIKHKGSDDFVANPANTTATKVKNIVVKKYGNIMKTSWWWQDDEFFCDDTNRLIQKLNEVNNFLKTDSEVAKLADELKTLTQK